VRRLRTERNLSQQALANRLGISASYVNLIEHDQRAISGALLIKLAEIFHLDLATLSGAQERQPEVGLREALSDPLLDADAVPDAEIAALAGSSPSAARAVLALYRAWRVAREDAGGIALPSGRRVLLPNEEARDAVDAVPRDAAPSSPEAAMLIRVVNYIAGAVLMPYPACLGGGPGAAPRHGGAGGPLWGLLRTGLSPAVDIAAARGARGAVLVCPRRPGGERLQALLRGGLSVRALWWLLPALGRAYRLYAAGRGPGAGRRAA
jgi:transcriptional regulator with XRE-family HTH domain